MLIGMITGLGGFTFGLIIALYFARMENRKNKIQADFLMRDIKHSLENMLHHYRQNYRFHDINYKVADLEQGTWHNKFLIEKFFLVTGLYEIDSAGHVRVRSNVDAALLERFLAEVQSGEFDKLLEIIADIPSGAFYSYSYHKKSGLLDAEDNVAANMPKNNLL